jgi:hypothetical protein
VQHQVPKGRCLVDVCGLRQPDSHHLFFGQILNASLPTLHMGRELRYRGYRVTRKLNVLAASTMPAEGVLESLEEHLGQVT